MGKMVIADVTEFPHLLIGGGTKSGKSSAIHSLLMSIIYKQSANKVKLLLFDFGASDIKVYDKVPHMLCPTIRSNEIEKGRDSLRWLHAEMEKRLIMKDSLEVRKFTVEMGKWQSIVCVIDEFPAFVRALTAEKHNKKAYTIIEDLLERARKVKIHLVLAAQGSTKDNIEIRTTNLGGRIAFKCNNRYESQAIIESSDAVDLSGKGVMYFKSDQHEGLMRVQGAYMRVEEIADMLDELYPADSYSEKRHDEMEFQINSSQEPDKLETTQNLFSTENEDEKLLFEMVMWMQGKENISNNQLKNNFEMGYERANRFLARLENAGIISKQKKGAKLPRTVDQNKIEEFLENHGYVEDTNKEDWVKCLEQSSMQNDMEPKHEQTIKASNEEMDAETHVECLPHEVPKTKERKLRIEPDKLKSHSTRYRKKGPAH